MTPDREDHVPERPSAHRASAPLPAASPDAAASLPEHVSHNIEAIRLLHIPTVCHSNDSANMLLYQ
jgi:hypothetical protein